MSKAKTFSSLAWLAVNVTTNQNKHHSFHPAYLSAIMWSSRKENRWKLFDGGREGNVALQDPYYFSFPLCPSLHFLPTPCVPLMSLSGQRALPFQTVTPQPWFLDLTVYRFPMGHAASSYVPGATQRWLGVMRLIEEVWEAPHILRP